MSPHPSVSPPQRVRVFVRPHDLEIETQRNGHPAFPAVIKRVHSAGPNVRMELRADSGELLQAEMPQDRYRALGIGVRQPGLRLAADRESLRPGAKRVRPRGRHLRTCLEFANRQVPYHSGGRGE